MLLWFEVDELSSLFSVLALDSAISEIISSIISNLKQLNMEAKKEVQEKEEYVSDSEYHTGSEFQPEFQSDNEPPEDKVAEAKLVVKHNDIRVYKKIIKIGTGMHMPAKYDKVVHRLVETPEETLSAVCLDGVEFVEKQMGITLLDQEIIYCLEHMRQGEISSFKIEHVTYTEKKKRILESERFLVAEMKSWETYIDLRGDFLCMKHMKKRGIGQKRFNILDEISFKARIYQDETNILRTYDANDTLVGNLVPRIPTTLVDMLMSSKAKEDLSVVCKPEYWLQFEKNEEFLALLDKDKDLVFDIEVEKIHELNDLYRDGSVLKKIIKPSYTTTNPDENSVLYFDYKIYDKDSNLIYSSKQIF